MSILHDGFKNMRQAVRDLLDGRATPVDSDEPHPLNEELWRIATHTPWVADAAVRMRDMGHVFHAEVFVVPTTSPTLEAVEDLTARLRASDWKTEDTVVVLTSEVPADIAGRSRPAG